jgi:hypothetical protein
VIQRCSVLFSGTRSKLSNALGDIVGRAWSDSVWPTRLSHVSALSKTGHFFDFHDSLKLYAAADSHPNARA